MSISKKRLKEIESIKDKEIDYSDIPELGNSFFKTAKLEMPKAKTPISLRVDPKVLEWYKSQGSGYQTKINAILKGYMEHQISSHAASVHSKKLNKHR